MRARESPPTATATTRLARRRDARARRRARATTRASNDDETERARLERGDAFGELVALAASNGVVVERRVDARTVAAAMCGPTATTVANAGTGGGNHQGAAARVEETAVVATARAERRTV